MQKQSLQTLKGFRDFLPAEKRVRDSVMTKIKSAFELYGFEPLETPTLEYAELLLGKYGDEADKLVYSFTDRGDRQVALRYDQTVPTARVLSQYQNELGKAFRRYQIQPVFRADKPQKGRYREFTQCDADIFGINSPLADAEILAVYYNIYKNLGLTDLVIELNDRQTLISCLSEFSTSDLPVSSIIQSIDKLDKQSVTETTAELVAKGLELQAAEGALSAIQSATPSQSLAEIIDAATLLGVPVANLKFNPALARGLDYYTGMIFEGKITGFSGSVGGGGRYDNLIESLGGPSIPAVGFGLGFDRTIEVLVARELISSSASTAVLVTTDSLTLQGETLKVAQALRSSGINAELYPDPSDKLGKQLKYASKKGITSAIKVEGIGQDSPKLTLINTQTGEESALSLDALVSKLR